MAEGVCAIRRDVLADGRKLCERHAARDRLWRRQHYAKRVKERVCTILNVPGPPPPLVLCIHPPLHLPVSVAEYHTFRQRFTATGDWLTVKGAVRKRASESRSKS